MKGIKTRKVITYLEAKNIRADCTTIKFGKMYLDDTYIKLVIQNTHKIVDLRNRKVLIEALFYSNSLVKEKKFIFSPARLTEPDGPT